jgi:DNA polymerase V
MRRHVLKWTRIPVSVGNVPTTTISKVSKKFVDRAGGNYVIDSEDKRIKTLKWLLVEDLLELKN